MTTARFRAAFPYQNDVLALPVEDTSQAATWYSHHFAMREVERGTDPTPFVILERDGTKIGFAENGGDPTQDGAAVLVEGIKEIRNEFEMRGITPSDWRIDEHDRKKVKVFLLLRQMDCVFTFTSRWNQKLRVFR